MNDATLWIAAGAIATVLSALVGWLLLNERRMGTFMTRDEHERMCDKRNAEVRESLSKIERSLARQDEESSQHWQMVDSALATLQTDVAVVKERLKQSWRNEP